MRPRRHRLAIAYAAFVLLFPPAAHPDEPLSRTAPTKITSPAIPDRVVALQRAQRMRRDGIVLSSVGLATTLASQVLLAFAYLSLPFDLGTDHRSSALPEFPALAASCSLSLVLGNALLGSGLGLWGTANHRIRDLRLGLSASAMGGAASLSIRF